jgi:AbrB family looped-hinge helix DNA binding protein
MERVVTKIGEGGRVVIPAEFRKQLGVRTGDEIVMVLEQGSVRLLTPREAVRRAQALVRRYVPEGVSLVEELIRERRQEAERE